MKRVTGDRIDRRGAIGRMLLTALVMGAILGIVGCGGGDDNGGGSGGGSSGGGASTQFAYVANFDSNNVSIFGIDANGALSSKGVVAAGVRPHMITVDPKGRFVYVANHDSNFLSGYVINKTTGDLTPVSSPTLTVGDNVHASAFDSQGRFLYVINGVDPAPSAIHAFTVNNDGTLTVIGTPLPAGVHAHNLTVDPTDKFVFVAAEVSNETIAYAIQPNGSLVQAASVQGSGGGVDAVAAVASFAYSANRGGLVQNFSVNQSTGALTPVAAQPTISSGTTTHAVATDLPNRNFLYAANINSSDISAYRIDKTSGTLAAITPGSPFGALGTEPEGLAASSGGFLYSANHGSNNITRFVINPNTGELTQGQVFPNATDATGPIAIAVTNF